MQENKTYYHNVPGSTYIDAKGEVHTFLGGQLTTDNPEVQAALDEQITRGNAMLSVGKPAPADAALAEATGNVTDAAANAAAMLAKLKAEQK